MIESEVERLRQLRNSALCVRAVARRLTGTRFAAGDALLDRGGCAAWRVARAASGHLRAHPYPAFRKDAGAGVLVKNSIIAAVAAAGVSNPAQARQKFRLQLKALSRALDDARALTWAPDLSDSFGRSQLEVRSLLNGLQRAGDALSEAPVEGAVGADWPYLAL